MSIAASPSRLSYDESTNVVLPNSLLDPTVRITDTSSSAQSSNKVMLKHLLIHDDLSQHSKLGELVMIEVLKIAELRGYD